MDSISRTVHAMRSKTRTTEPAVDGGIEPTADSRDEGRDRVLVLDAHKNAAVVSSRALAGEDVDITAGGWSRLSPGMLSRLPSDRFVYPSPYQHPDRFITELKRNLQRNDYLAVIPISDLSHVLLSKHKQRLEGTGTAIGAENWDTFVSANNKKNLVSLLDDLSVPSPYTRAPESVDAVADMKDGFSYPVVIKPQYTTVKTADGRYVEARISEENYVRDPTDLAPQYRSLVEKYPYFTRDLPIVQEVVSGTVMATCGIAKDGEFVEHFQEERLRTYPVGGGSSSLRQGIHCPEMIDHSRKIVDALDWTGPIYVEFIKTPDEGCYALEINGRYWGSVGCAVHSGVNVPLLHYRQLRGIDPPPSRPYQVGLKQRRLFYTDLKWLTAQLAAGNVDAVAPFIVSFFDADHDLLSFDDPMVALGAILWAIQEIVQGNGPGDGLASKTPDIGAKISEHLGGSRQ